jgi:hypothetical protein
MASCGGGEMKGKVEPAPLLKDTPVVTWEKLAGKVILFGHQSVGDNIIDGMKALIAENPRIKLLITESKSASDLKGPVFAHFKIGKNEDPKSKMEDFAETLKKGLGDRVDIAFMKLCFVDVRSDSNVKDIFANYRDTARKLIGKYPKVVFVHITAPLTTTQTGVKVWIKKIIGRAIGGYEDNMKRQEFNDLLRAEYAGKEPLFDLAGVESTYPDGKRELFTKEGKSYPSLVPLFTDDGGHLNKTGRKIVAEQLLILLAELANK